MNKAFLPLFLIACISVVSCGGGSSEVDNSVVDNSGEDNSGEDNSGEDNSGEDNSGEDNSGEDNSGEDASTTGSIDLVDYLFDDNLDVVGDEFTYPVTVYSHSTGEVVFPGTTNVKWAKTTNNTIVYSVVNDPANSFEIYDNKIVETVHGSPDLYRDLSRFVDVGGTYMNANADNSLLGELNATCVVDGLLPSFNLANATGSYNLASGIYNDVLEVNCVTKVVSSNTPIADMQHYFARGVGEILSSGNAIFVGNAYFISDR